MYLTSLGKKGARIDIEQKLKKLPKANTNNTNTCCLVNSFKLRALGSAGCTSSSCGWQLCESEHDFSTHLVFTAWVLQNSCLCWGALKSDGARTKVSPGLQKCVSRSFFDSMTAINPFWLLFLV